MAAFVPRRARFLGPILALCLLLAACAGVDSMRPGPAGPPPGNTMLYSQPPDKVFEAALRALPLVGLRLMESEPAKGYILAERGVNAWSYGENVGVYLTPKDRGTLVTIASKRKMATNVAAKDFAQPLHMQIGALLGSSAAQK